MRKSLQIAKTSVIVCWFLFAGFSSLHAQDTSENPEITTREEFTLFKLKSAARVFKQAGFKYSSKYVRRYLALTGGQVVYPAAEVMKEPTILSTLEEQRNDDFAPAIEELVEEGVWVAGAGYLNPGPIYSLQRKIALPRPSGVPTDFMLAIGGCKLYTVIGAQVIRYPPPPGSPESPEPPRNFKDVYVVRIVYWKTLLTDKYKWDYNDAVLASLGIFGFQPGEVHRLEELGLAKRFKIESEAMDFSDNKVLTAFLSYPVP